ncbi:polysaccharide deacetylase family protein [Clostridium tertium]|uniref:Peptidoglycan-N-acetylglucosamine deacetylase n=1 Tax=Clostridium tertium TaxID=1559 RepID=A0A6N3ETR0_9CLOT
MKKIFKNILIIQILLLNICLLYPSFKVFAFSNFSNEEVTDESENAGPKVIYLTFDDGPGGKVTNEILDTLKKEDIKATFFVIGSEIKGQEDILLRMKDEGHSIGLHSYSHDRNKLYCNNAGFLKEMQKGQDEIFRVTGEKYNILRFPFGCNNKSYRLTKSLVDEIHNNNYKIYDWTLDSEDGANYSSSPSTIAKKSYSSKNNVVLLMHCGFINKNSAKALPSIIKYYKDKGYEFKTITEDTPEIYKITR